MSKFLLAWELGGALGHLAALRALATPLVERGHEVLLALRDLKHAPQFFPDWDCLAAPLHRTQGPASIAEPSTFADILATSGWSDAQELEARVGQWHGVFDDFQPDAVVCNFAPTAVLAAQGRSARVVLFGTGFHTPPDCSPLPDLCPWRDNYPGRLQFTERQVLNSLNKQLGLQGVAEVERVTELFCRADANLLTTLPEMDHYEDRKNGRIRWAVGRTLGDGPRLAPRQRPSGVCISETDGSDALFARRAATSRIAYARVRTRNNRDGPKPSRPSSCVLSTLRSTYNVLPKNAIWQYSNAGHNTTLRILPGRQTRTGATPQRRAVPRSAESGEVISRDLRPARSTERGDPSPPSNAK